MPIPIPISMAARLRALRLFAAAWISTAMLLSGCDGPEPTELDLDRLLELHAEARGGSRALERVRSMIVELEITEPEFTVTGTYVATREGWMRIDVFAGGERVFTEAIGPEGGWQMHADGVPIELSPDGKAALERGIYGNLYALHELSGHGYTYRLVGRREGSEDGDWQIEQIAPGGFRTQFLLDPETYLISSTVSEAALHPDIDPTSMRKQTRYLEHVEVAGLVFAARSESVDLGTGDVVQTDVVLERKINPPIDERRFLAPPAP